MQSFCISHKQINQIYTVDSRRVLGAPVLTVKLEIYNVWVPGTRKNYLEIEAIYVGYL